MMLASCLLLLAFASGGPASAQSYPTKPIRIVVPFGAGAGVDILARGFGKALTERLGQPVVVENRPGAGGNIGTEVVAKAAPDGYTLVMGSNGPFAANVSLYDKLPFDPLKDLAPVILMGRLPMILIANDAVSAASVTDMIQLAKARPGTLNFGASNTTARVWIELLKNMAGINVATVPYKNVGALLTDLMGGQIQYAFENVGPSLPLIRSSKIKALAVTSQKRASFASQIPAFGEFGLTRYDLVVWLALFAPKGTPAEITQRLNAEINKIMQESPEIVQLIASIGMEPAGGSPEQLGEYHKAEIAKWDELVKATGVRLD
ncbi:MAG: tripartite tricarboxylate transporter substrate binding protein [Proteobacteria bacterium]|nr:tripartite tricarboxylate transporter substrate binding protein [Pseudomonadota bacterium]